MEERKSTCPICKNEAEYVTESHFLDYGGFLYEVKDVEQMLCETCEGYIVSVEKIEIMKRTIDAYKGRVKLDEV